MATNKSRIKTHNLNEVKAKSKRRLNAELKFYKDQLYGEEKKEDRNVMRIDSLKSSIKYYNKRLSRMDSFSLIPQELEREIGFLEKLKQ